MKIVQSWLTPHIKWRYQRVGRTTHSGLTATLKCALPGKRFSTCRSPAFSSWSSSGLLLVPSEAYQAHSRSARNCTRNTLATLCRRWSCPVISSLMASTTKSVHWFISHTVSSSAQCLPVHTALAGNLVRRDGMSPVSSASLQRVLVPRQHHLKSDGLQLLGSLPASSSSTTCLLKLKASGVKLSTSSLRTDRMQEM